MRSSRPRTSCARSSSTASRRCARPPTIYRFLIREDLTKYDLSSLEYCTTAGEALNGAVYDTFLQPDGRPSDGGLRADRDDADAGHVPVDEVQSPGAWASPIPSTGIDLVTPDGRSAEDGEQGQIVIRTDGGKPLGLFKGYYLNDELTREAWHDGVYYTGDVAWRDEDGYYWFVGRADDVIKSSGYRIGPFEVESALMTHPAVVECAITGVPDEIRGQVVKATIVLAEAYRGQAGEALDQGVAGPCEAHHGSLQIPARDRVRGVAAQDHQRQDPPQGDPQRRRREIIRPQAGGERDRAEGAVPLSLCGCRSGAASRDFNGTVYCGSEKVS